MRHFYKFNTRSVLGKEFRSLWNKCIKADKARVKFREKVGAVAFCPNDMMFAGGVDGVYFEDDTKVDRRIWQEAGKAEDGAVCWVPIVKQRAGTVVVENEANMPGDVVNRIYSKRRLKNEKGQMVVPFIELYRDDEESKSRIKGYKMSWPAKESIRIAKGMLTLPVVRMEQILHLLQADPTEGKGNDGRMRVVRMEAPTFFQYSRHIYVGCACPCHAEGLKEIAQADYIDAEKAVRELHRVLAVAN